MAFSVNTNAGALAALQALNDTNRRVNVVQNRINTGLKVASSKDNAAVFNIAQKQRAELGGLNAVKASIDRSLGVIDVALAAGNAVSDLLIELKEKAVAAKDIGLDTASRSALNDEFNQLKSQINTIVNNAEFNGTNVVENGGDAVVAILSDDASATITIAAQDLSLTGTNVAITAGSSISTQDLASAAVDAIQSSISAVGTALSALGAGAKRLELQQDFVGRLSDAIEVGIGNLVDADLAKEAANQTSLQVKQQLGLQALSIANQAPQAVLSLFQ